MVVMLVQLLETLLLVGEAACLLIMAGIGSKGGWRHPMLPHVMLMMVAEVAMSSLVLFGSRLQRFTAPTPTPGPSTHAHTHGSNGGAASAGVTPFLSRFMDQLRSKDVHTSLWYIPEIGHALLLPLLLPTLTHLLRAMDRVWPACGDQTPTHTELTHNGHTHDGHAHNGRTENGHAHTHTTHTCVRRLRALVPCSIGAVCVSWGCGLVLLCMSVVFVTNVKPEMQQVLGTVVVHFPPDSGMMRILQLVPIITPSLYLVYTCVLAGLVWGRWLLAASSIVCFFANIGQHPFTRYVISAYSEVLLFVVLAWEVRVLLDAESKRAAQLFSKKSDGGGDVHTVDKNGDGRVEHKGHHDVCAAPTSVNGNGGHVKRRDEEGRAPDGHAVVDGSVAGLTQRVRISGGSKSANSAVRSVHVQNGDS